MRPVAIGKFYDFSLPEIQNYDAIYHDICWYFLHQTQVSRFVSRESFRIFLTRLLFIQDREINESAEDFINHGVILGGSIGAKSFEFKAKDLFNFIGFESAASNYHVYSSQENFIQSYQYKALNPTIDYDEVENEFSFDRDSFFISMIGLTSLLEIQSLSIRFKKDLQDLSSEKIYEIENFVDYVMKFVPETIFENYLQRVPHLPQSTPLYFEKNKVVSFDPFQSLERKTLIEIFSYILPDDDWLVEELQQQKEIDEDLLDDLRRDTAIIKFAYGVKHGYIELNDDIFPYNNYSDQYDIDVLEDLAGPDCECYPTSTIYEMNEIEKWIHLIP
ncbi:MAG: hypothetical protein ACQEW9_04910 [Bacteroidota bacterium]